MVDESIELLYQKNKFLREVERAPVSDKSKLILLWSIEDKTFSTDNFHPTKVHYRLTVEEIKKVAVGDQVISYLQMTKNYEVYLGMKRLVLLPTFFLVLFMGLMFWFLPNAVEKAGKTALSIIMVAAYITFMILTVIVVKVWGAAAQERRYMRRESDFTKIFQYFNKKVFMGKGISFECGKYGSYIQINLVHTKSKLPLLRTSVYWPANQQFHDPPR